MVFRATDTGGTDELRAVSSRKLAGALDKCGRTILHKAILNKKKDMIKFVVETYPHVIDIQDSVSAMFGADSNTHSKDGLYVFILWFILYFE